MSTRTLTCLAAGALAATAALTAFSGSATAATPAYTVTPITVQVTVGPNNDQPCSVDADLYLPTGASPSKPVPAILTTNGFGGSKDDSNQAAIGRGFATAGYAVLSYSGLGFGKTTCKIELDDPDWDGKAGKQMDDVLAGTRPYVDQGTGATHYLRSIAMQKPGDPRVGMIGGSYGGQIQYAVAEQDPRIDTIVPIITWNDLTYSLAPGDVAKKEWVGLFFGDGIVSGAENATADPTTMVGGCPNFTDQACAGAAELQTQGYPSAATTALAEHASVATYMSRIKVPTLLVQGEADTLFNLNEASATYAALKKQGTPVKMVWQSWGHSHSNPAPGELDFGAASLRDSYLGARFLDWMNHYVRGTSSASTGPEFAYFRDWVPYDTDPSQAAAGVAKAYATSSTVSVATPRTLYFTGNDALTPTASKVTPGLASYANAGPAPTSYSETSGVEDQLNNPPTDGPGTFAAFTSAALKSPAEVVGSPKVTLHLTAPVAAQSQAQGPSGQLVLFAKVYDVAPDGTKTLSNRLVAPLRVTDVTKPVTVTLPGIVHRFGTGHQVQVVVAASDAAYAGNAVPQPVTITTSPTAPSTLTLPMTSGLTFTGP
ncbi:MAG: prolyl oligopeptidase family serine peptidase [Marmoricola sp.]|nr:prolyl oligopeptidase family serine peptidase [Marmoricola sp.]